MKKKNKWKKKPGCCMQFISGSGYTTASHALEKKKKALINLSIHTPTIIA